jgi:hypothetical protein
MSASATSAAATTLGMTATTRMLAVVGAHHRHHFLHLCHHRSFTSLEISFSALQTVSKISNELGRRLLKALVG